MDRDFRRPDDPRAVAHGSGAVPDKTIGVLYEPNAGTPLGTCFAFQRPGVFLTAAHNLEGQNDIEVFLPDGRNFSVGRARRHKDVDVAVVELPQGSNVDDLECLTLDPREDGDMGLFPALQDVASCGYTLRSETHSVDMRWMQGHVQRHMNEDTCYELSYASFPGNSGSPVMPKSDINKVIALVSQGCNFSCKVKNGGTTTAHWTVAVALAPIENWLRSTIT